MEQRRFLILGAGPTGLGGAKRLLDLGESGFLILERSSQAGGLASSHRDCSRFTWDLGSHLYYSHYDKIDDDLRSALAPAGTNRCLSPQSRHDNHIRATSTSAPYQQPKSFDESVARRLRMPALDRHWLTSRRAFPTNMPQSISSHCKPLASHFDPQGEFAETARMESQ